MNRLRNVIILLLSTIGTTSFAQSKDSLSTSTCIPKLDTLDNQKVYSLLDKMPEYPEGGSSMMKYIQENLKYPSHFDDWQGSIYLTFVIDTTGKIRNACVFKTHKDNNELSGIEMEALRIINEMPTWTPGQNHGEKVYARVNLPIKFGLK